MNRLNATREFSRVGLLGLAGRSHCDLSGTGGRVRRQRSARHSPRNGRDRTGRATATSTSIARRIRSGHWLAGRIGTTVLPARAWIRAIRFGYDPATSRDGTMVAGHPAILTVLDGRCPGTLPVCRSRPIRRRVSISEEGCFSSGYRPNRATARTTGHARRASRCGRPAGERVYLGERCTGRTISGRSLDCRTQSVLAGPIRTSRAWRRHAGSASC